MMNEVCLLFPGDVLHHLSRVFHLNERDKKLVFGEGQAMSIPDA